MFTRLKKTEGQVCLVFCHELGQLSQGDSGSTRYNEVVLKCRLCVAKMEFSNFLDVLMTIVLETTTASEDNWHIDRIFIYAVDVCIDIINRLHSLFSR